MLFSQNRFKQLEGKKIQARIDSK